LKDEDIIEPDLRYKRSTDMAMSQEEMDTLINSSNDPTQQSPDTQTQKSFDAQKTAANSTQEHKTKDKNF